MLAEIKRPQNAMQRYFINKEPFYDFIIPVFGINDKHIAAVRIGFPVKLITNKTNTMIAYSFGLAFVLLIFGILLLVFLYNMWIGKPLDKLTAVIRDIRQTGTDSAQMVNIDSKDEIGELASAFNDMLIDLKNTHKK